MANERNTVSTDDGVTSKAFIDGLDEIKFKQDVTKVGNVGVVISLTRVWY